MYSSLNDYKKWLVELKEKIRHAQTKVTLAANRELIELYWYMGEQIFIKQSVAGWGNAVVDELEKDLKKEFPSIKRFSRRNLFYMKSFYILKRPL